MQDVFVGLTRSVRDHRRKHSTRMKHHRTGPKIPWCAPILIADTATPAHKKAAFSLAHVAVVPYTASRPTTFWAFAAQYKPVACGLRRACADSGGARRLEEGRQRLFNPRQVRSTPAHVSQRPARRHPPQNSVGYDRRQSSTPDGGRFESTVLSGPLRTGGRKCLYRFGQSIDDFPNCRRFVTWLGPEDLISGREDDNLASPCAAARLDAFEMGRNAIT